MCDHAFNTLVTSVSRDVGVSEDTRRIEDVEAFVLHRAHIEVIDGNDIEEFEVVLQAVHILIPSHRSFQRFHRVVAVTHVFRLYPDFKCHAFAALGDKIALDQR